MDAGLVDMRQRDPEVLRKTHVAVEGKLPNEGNHWPALRDGVATN